MSTGTIRNMLAKAQMRAAQRSKDTWTALRYQALDFYDGITQDYIEGYYTGSALKFVVIANNNITKRIINRVSLVYMVPPIRTLNGKSDDDYKNLTSLKDIKLKRAERWTNLLGLVALRPVWNQENKLFDYYLITDFELEFDDKDPLKPTAINYPTADSFQVRKTKKEVWERVDEYGWQRYAKGEDPHDQGDHTYGRLPIIFCFKDGMPEKDFLDVYPAMDLIQSNLGLNVMLTDMRMNLRFQGHGKWIAKGVDDDFQMSFSPDIVTVLPERDANVEIISPPDSISSAMEAIKNEYKLLALNYGLDPSFVEGTRPESGIALKLRNLELTENRKGSVETWRVVEKELFELEQIIAREDAGINLKGSFNVDFSESTEILSAQEQRDQDTFDLEHNIISVGDIIKRRNPDMPKEEADKLAKENKDVNTTTQPTANNTLAEILGEE